MSSLPLPIPDVLKRTDQRFEKLLQLLNKTQSTERTVTACASVHAFVEKRAALQEKIASTKTQLAEKLTETIAKNSLLNRFVGQGLLFGGPAIGLGLLAAPTLESWGQTIKTKFPGTAPTPEQLQREAKTKAIENFAASTGKELGKKTVGLLANMLSSALQTPGNVMQTMTRKSIFDTLRQEDDVIAQADPQQLEEAYHTMVRFAPTLATDKNAVKTFLRESVLYGTGPNFMSIKQLADAEKAVLGPQLPPSRS